jgi:hypothetical protein
MAAGRGATRRRSLALLATLAAGLLVVAAGLPNHGIEERASASVASGSCGCSPP